MRCMRERSTSPTPTGTVGREGGGGGRSPARAFLQFDYSKYTKIRLYTQQKLYTTTRIRFKIETSFR